MFIFAFFSMIRLAVLGAVFWAGGLVYFLQLVPDSTTQVKAKYDIIIVLTGGQERIPYAVQLLKGGVAEHLFISGVADGFNVGEFERGLPNTLKSRISYGDTAKSTIGNAEETAKWLAKHDYRKLLIVTANYHLPRTKMLFNHYLADYEKKYAAVVPPDFKLREWTQHDNSRRLVFSEYNKLIITWIRLATMMI